MYIFEDRNKNTLNIKESLSLAELKNLGIEIGFNEDNSAYIKLNGEDISSSVNPEFKAWVEAQLDTKIDKITDASANPRVYGVSEEGEQTSYFATQTPNANTIPLRDASGRFQVADGVAPKQVVNKSQLDLKLDLAGGTVTGDLAVQGDLTVAGTTKSEKNKSLIVEDNVIVTNANKVDLQVLLSGLAINKSADATYGIMYDPADDTVKFGQGTLDENNRFTFNENEGAPLAIRDNAKAFTDAHLIKWDSTSNKFVDAGIASTEVALLDEQNTFTAPNTFTEEVQFNKGIASDDAISITNAVLKVMNNSDNGDGTQKDYVAQYDADKILLEENGTNFTLNFPKKSGTLAVTEDIPTDFVDSEALNTALEEYAKKSDIPANKVPFNYSEFTTEDVLGTKEDGWKLTDDTAQISIYHQNTVSQTGLTISKNHVGIQATEDIEENKTSAAVLALSSDTISMYVNSADGTSSTGLVLDKDSAKLNDVKIATVVDLEGKVNTLAESVVNQIYAKTQNGNEGISYSYAAEGGTIAQRSAAGTLAVEDPTQEQDAANKKYVDSACKNIPAGVEITNVPGAINGLVADDDYLKLTTNPNEYIVKDGKQYKRSSDRSTEDSYTYVYNGYLNNRDYQESIEITVSSKSWVLNSAKLITDKTIANGQLGAVSIKADFADGLEVSQADGNLSIYGALDADIAGRASKRPITPTNLNKAVLAALTDTERVIPDEDQQAAFKAAWGFTESQIDITPQVIELTPDTAQNGTLTDEQFSILQNDSTARIKLNNEYYILMDEGHTEGIISYIHTGWNGETDQTKSINITTATKAWTLKTGEHNYYHHYIYLTVDTDKFIYYDFPSTQATAYTIATLPAQPDVSATTFTLLYNGRYASISGQIYRNAAGDLKAILHGIYTTDGTTFAYLALDGVNVTFNSDTVQKID